MLACPASFWHKSFGTLTAAHCELPGLTNPSGFSMGHTGSVTTVNATQPPSPDAAGRKGHDWQRGSICLLLVLAVLSDCCVLAAWGGQARNMAGMQRCKEKQTIDIPISAPWESSLSQDVPESIAPSPWAQLCMDMGLNKKSWQYWLMQLQQSALWQSIFLIFQLFVFYFPIHSLKRDVGTMNFFPPTSSYMLCSSHITGHLSGSNTQRYSGVSHDKTSIQSCSVCATLLFLLPSLPCLILWFPSPAAALKLIVRLPHTQVQVAGQIFSACMGHGSRNKDICGRLCSGAVWSSPLCWPGQASCGEWTQTGVKQRDQSEKIADPVLCSWSCTMANCQLLITFQYFPF